MTGPVRDCEGKLAVELLGDRGAEPASDLDVYRRAIEGDVTR